MTFAPVNPATILPFLYRDPFPNATLLAVVERGTREGDVWAWGRTGIEGVLVVSPEPRGGRGIGLEATTTEAVEALLDALPPHEEFRFALHRAWMIDVLERTCRVEHEGVMRVFRCRRGSLRPFPGGRPLGRSDLRAVRRCGDEIFLRSFRQSVRQTPSARELALRAFGVFEGKRLVARCLTTWGDTGIDRLVGTVWSVYTEPGFRQRGFGRAVVAAATGAILESDRTARYFAYQENAASQRLCLDLGYEHDHDIHFFHGTRRATGGGATPI